MMASVADGGQHEASIGSTFLVFWEESRKRGDSIIGELVNNRQHLKLAQC